MRFLETETNDGILKIQLNRPDALNALNNEMIQEIGEVLSANVAEEKVEGIIITGSGEKAFAAGADIKGFPLLDENAANALSRDGHQVFDWIENYPKPIIAAVNGFALGGGLELAMACHMRVASENASFGMPEVKLGLIPGYGGTQRLAQLIGKAKAMEYILTADMMDAQVALQLGLVNHVVPNTELLTKATEILKKISKRGPTAVSTAIKLVNKSSSREGFELEIENFGKLLVSKEGREGVQAFLAKRKPNFRN